MNVEGNFTFFPEMRPAAMVVSHERSGTHFLMNSLAACYGYVANPFINFDRPDVEINYCQAMRSRPALHPGCRTCRLTTTPRATRR